MSANRISAFWACAAFSLFFSSACTREAAEPHPVPAAQVHDATRPPARQYPRDVVQIAMRNVRLHVDDGIVLEIRRLRGEMVSRVKGRPPVFDDQRSYVLHVDDASLSMDVASLTNLMNRHVFDEPESPLRRLTARLDDDGRLEVKGRLHKGIAVPFSSKVSASATADGRLRLHVESFKALGVPATGLLEVFGLELDDLVALERRRDVAIADNDIVIAPGEALPPPEIRGRLSRVTLVGPRLVQTFGRADGRRPAALAPPDPSAPNYVYFSGGDIQFGKLTMSGADLQLIDLDPRDAFDFFPAHYDAQLVAGYSKNTPAHGLKTYMPDFDDLARRTARSPAPPAARQ